MKFEYMDISDPVSTFCSLVSITGCHYKATTRDLITVGGGYCINVCPHFKSIDERNLNVACLLENKDKIKEILK